MADEEGAQEENEHIASADCLQESSYVYIRTLGRGAFGEAVLYRKTEDNSLVVWKEMNLLGLTEKEVIEAQNEVEILSMLNHANVVSYYNHFLDSDTLFIEMEYANGGTLHSRISNQTELFEEQLVIWYMYQLLSAVAFIHDFGILHRDIKTMNIFSTKTDLIKLGDFGISKVLENNSQMADTFVGTPYYMSPELVKGDRYNYKSDVWALGCVLYELLTLNKPFSATNPLRLAQAIVTTDSDDISSFYSADICQLSKVMLSKEADLRPSVDEILTHASFTNNKEAMEQKIWQLNSPVRRARSSAASMSDTIPIVTSKTSEVYQWGGGRKVPHNWEVFHGERGALQVSTGRGHFAVVTVEKELYTWTAGQCDSPVVGQLGHNDRSEYKAPKRVDALAGVGVNQASCGDGFTVCITDDGRVYSFGSNFDGCLGLGHTRGDTVLSPTLIPAFVGDVVIEIACGETHVAAVTSSNQLYTWGSGEFGCLGLGSEDDVATPQKVKLRGHLSIRHVRVGLHATFVLSSHGRVLACGSNEHNKLGFNSSARGLRRRQTQISYDVQCKKTFSLVRSLNCHHITDLSAGPTHTAVIDFYGFLYTFGSNKHGQLGVGDCRRHHGVCRVRGALMSQRVWGVSCGDEFTLASTLDSQIYAWGNAENGRLGLATDASVGPNVVTSPRPIFGSLHAVPLLSSRHWYTLIVAEKLLNRKAVKVRIPSPKSVTVGDSPDADEGDEGDGGFLHEPDPESLRRPINVQHSQLATDSTHPDVPDWLKREMMQAEYIPVRNADDPSEPITSSPQRQDVISEKASQEDIKKLHERISTLEEENRALRTKNEQVDDSERDSGTESDDENVELEQQELEQEEMNARNHGDTSSYGSISSPLVNAADSRSNSPAQEISDTATLTAVWDDATLDELSSTSDFERCSLDFERNSSEDELSVIDELRGFESQKQRRWSEERLTCDSAASTDDEIQQLMLPQPVLFSESPPPLHTEKSRPVQHGPSPRLYITSVTPVNSVSPRKRTRQTSLSDSMDEDTENSVRRPCLDFEKMQTVNAPLTRSKCRYKPEIYTFRSISMSPFNKISAIDNVPYAF